MKEAHLPLPGIPIPFLFQHLGQRQQENENNKMADKYEETD
jgi:hypothetical protein